MEASTESCAALVMDAALLVVRLLRAEIRRTRPGSLSVNQVRALGCLGRFPDSDLSTLAEYLGLTLPSASHLAEGLVRQGLVARRTAEGDRRRLMLKLTARGERTLELAYRITRAHLSDRLAPLNSAERALVAESMKLLRPLVAPGAPASGAP